MLLDIKHFSVYEALLEGKCSSRSNTCREGTLLHVEYFSRGDSSRCQTLLFYVKHLSRGNASREEYFSRGNSSREGMLLERKCFSVINASREGILLSILNTPRGGILFSILNTPREEMLLYMYVKHSSRGNTSRGEILLETKHLSRRSTSRD